MNKPELLAPAGNLEKLKICCIYGADAVFIGGQEHGLRSNADNFSFDQIKEGVEFAKKYGVDIYVTTNIYAHEINLKGFKEFAMHLEKCGVVGVIISDPAYINIIKENNINLEIHISTQQSITNYESVLYYESLGVDRVVLARELSFEEIEEVCKNTSTEIEVFIHGAVCSSYSGRCTLSNFMTTKDSNRGGCVQSCRWNYDLVYKEDDSYINVAKTDETRFSMSAKDMQLLNYIPRLCTSGIDSLKVEGRMKSHHYVATVIKVYRMAIDEYFKSPDNYEVKKEWIDEIRKAESRQTYEGALIGELGKNDQIFNEQYVEKKAYDYCGYVLDYNSETKLALIEQRNYFEVNDEIEFFGPGNKINTLIVSQMYDETMNTISKANHPLMKLYVKIDFDVEQHWMIRKAKK